MLVAAGPAARVAAAAGVAFHVHRAPERVL